MHIVSSVQTLMVDRTSWGKVWWMEMGKGPSLHLCNPVQAFPGPLWPVSNTRKFLWSNQLTPQFSDILDFSLLFPPDYLPNYEWLSWGQQRCLKGVINCLKQVYNMFLHKLIYAHCRPISLQISSQTSQELRMLSSVTLNCQVFIVMDSGFQLSEL